MVTESFSSVGGRNRAILSMVLQQQCQGWGLGSEDTYNAVLRQGFCAFYVLMSIVFDNGHAHMLVIWLQKQNLSSNKLNCMYNIVCVFSFLVPSFLLLFEYHIF